MKRRGLIVLTLLILSLTLSSGAASAKDKWTRVRSKNFTLVGNAGERDTRKVALRLEQFRDVFSRLFTKAPGRRKVSTDGFNNASPRTSWCGNTRRKVSMRGFGHTPRGDAACARVVGKAYARSTANLTRAPAGASA